MKNRTTAAFVALFFGFLGIHRFYLGDTKKGVICLCCFWTIIYPITAIADAVALFNMSDEAFDKLYNKGSVRLIAKAESAETDATGDKKSLKHELTKYLKDIRWLYKKGIISQEEYFCERDKFVSYISQNL